MSEVNKCYDQIIYDPFVDYQNLLFLFYWSQIAKFQNKKIPVFFRLYLYFNSDLIGVKLQNFVDKTDKSMESVFLFLIRFVLESNCKISKSKNASIL